MHLPAKDCVLSLRIKTWSLLLCILNLTTLFIEWSWQSHMGPWNVAIFILSAVFWQKCVQCLSNLVKLSDFFFHILSPFVLPYINFSLVLSSIPFLLIHTPLLPHSDIYTLLAICCCQYFELNHITALLWRRLGMKPRKVLMPSLGLWSSIQGQAGDLVLSDIN